MPSFDIVSKTELAEVDNAVRGVIREIGTRFGLQGFALHRRAQGGADQHSGRRRRETETIQELLKGYITRRKLDAGASEFKEPQKASGNALRQEVIVKQGIDQVLAKKKSSRKSGQQTQVQVSIQGDELRYPGKKKDDLQMAIQFVRGLKIEQPLQYVNFRD